VVDAARAGAARDGVAEQQPTPAAHIEQAVTRPERERAEDRVSREVVHILGAVDLPSARAARAPRDAVGQPVLERVVG